MTGGVLAGFVPRWTIEVKDPEGIPAEFTPAVWRVLQDGVAPITILLSPAGAWTQLPRAVADQLLDRGPGGRGVVPRGLVYLLAEVTAARWTGPFELGAAPRAVAGTMSWTATRLLVDPAGRIARDGEPS